MAWSSAWRAEVRDQAQRLEYDLARVPSGDQVAAYQEAQATIQKARSFSQAAPSITTWWSGTDVEGAWANLGAAREALLLIQDAAAVRAQLPYLRSLAAKSVVSEGIIPTSDADALVDRAALTQVIRVHNVRVAAEHGNVRRLRNGVIGLAGLLALIMTVATIATDREHRTVIGLGAIAGALTTVLAVTSAERAPGPYGLLGPQALLKVFAGAATALLAAVLLFKGVGSLGPAQGDAAYFIAVIFGFSQQLFTQLVDSTAKSVLGQATPRSGAPPSTGTKVTASP